MKKKTYIILFSAILILALGTALFFFAQRTITPEEAEELCFTVMGEKDEATGFPFSFGVTGTYEIDGEEYYVVRATWLVNNDHMSYIGDFFVTTDGKKVYTGIVTPEECIIENLIWSK